MLWVWILLGSAVHGQTDSAIHTVKPGDSLTKIARGNGCTVEALAKANGLKLSTVIQPGQKLKLPGKALAQASAPPAASAQSAVAGKTHTVKAGDTYSSISRKYGISVASLQAANPGVKPTALRPGQTIRLSAVEMSAPSAALEPAPATAPVPAPTEVPSSTPVPAPSQPAAPPADSTAPDSQPPQTSEAQSDKKIRSVMVESEITFAEFAAMHGTDITRLNELNGLDLTSATVLAKGSELYVPAQP